MKLTFRWYGEKDCIPLNYIKQIQGMTGVVTAVYDVPVGEVWELSKLERLKSLCNNAGLEMEVIESIPVHEDIKLGKPTRDKLIANYSQNVINCGKVGVKCVCYNFMPVFDWLRSDLHRPMANGANSLAYDEETVRKMDPAKEGLSLPGWDESYSREELRALLARYENVGEEQLWHNLQNFLEAVIPVAASSGIHMAIHPDDPPWGIFGLPRIITSEKNIDRFLKLVDDEANGLTFCTGSLGADPDNDLVKMAQKYAKRIPFAHIRNIRRTGYRQFHEVAHPTECGSLDIYGILSALHRGGFDAYVRPDHGRMIWGENGRPGYGLYDRALGAMYLAGMIEAIEKGDR